VEYTSNSGIIIFVMHDLQIQLQHLGLSDKESKVYLAALELGPSPVQDISRKSKVNRATTYVMIESLSARGLMSTFQKGKKRYYVSESPERLVQIIETEQKVLASKRDELEGMMPVLSSLYNSEGAKPQVRYFEGIDGLETTRSIFEKLPGEFLQIVPFDEVLAFEESLHGRDEHIERLKKKKGLSGRVLAVVSDPEKSKVPELKGVEVRYVSHDTFPIHGELTVRGNHVFLFSHKSSVLSVVLVSQEIADVVRALFELAWKK
jgi:HTH-type transcriptional regulator, sugar sensing transcriptional regulator